MKFGLWRCPKLCCYATKRGTSTVREGFGPNPTEPSLTVGLVPRQHNFRTLLGLSARSESVIQVRFFRLWRQYETEFTLPATLPEFRISWLSNERRVRLGWVVGQFKSTVRYEFQGYELARHW